MKRKNLGRAVLVLFLLLPALAVWWPLWFMGTGALMPLDELRAALGPVLQGAEGSAFWPLLPSWPTLQPLAELLLDTPQFFTMFWNTCAIVFPQVLGQVLVGAPAARETAAGKTPMPRARPPAPVPAPGGARWRRCSRTW